jgi:hypothetical protein
MSATLSIPRFNFFLCPCLRGDTPPKKSGIFDALLQWLYSLSLWYESISSAKQYPSHFGTPKIVNSHCLSIFERFIQRRPRNGNRLQNHVTIDGACGNLVPGYRPLEDLLLKTTETKSADAGEHWSSGGLFSFGMEHTL